VPSDLQFAAVLSDSLRLVLREAREAAELSLGEVAARSGLNRQAISFIENGDRRPTTETLSRLVMALGMRPAEAWAMAESRIPSKTWKRVLAASLIATSR
jgi:transcriptional regulator with XRE-family HTH domain